MAEHLKIPFLNLANYPKIPEVIKKLPERVDEMMSEVADMYQRDVEYEIKTLNAQVEPILIVCLGIMVLILALGVFLPIWDFGKVAIHKQ